MNPTRQHRLAFRWPFRRAANENSGPERFSSERSAPERFSQQDSLQQPPANAAVSPATLQPASSALPSVLMPVPTPVLRWATGGRIAVRAFDFLADADAVCAFQAETYEFNFPDFRYTPEFGQAFRFDLRRASLDSQHGLFVLDDRWAPSQGSEGSEGDTQNGLSAAAPVPALAASRSQLRGVCGFLWLVLCQNTWTGERYGYVNNLYLAPHRRGQGLGRELLGQCDHFFRSRGIHRVRLTVSAHNAAAVHLYEGNGYGVTRWEMEKTL